MKTLHILFLISTIISLVIIGESSILAQTSHQSAGIENLQLDTPKSNYVDGEIIPISGYTLQNLVINIFLVDNRGNIENSTQVRGNNTGYFDTSLGIPLHVEGGAWSLFAKSGESNFATQVMVNAHGENPPPFNAPSGFAPLKQFKLGIESRYIQCKTGLQLVIKSEDGSPACVKPDTASILIERGWGIIPLAGLPTNHNNSIDKSSGIVSIGNQTTQGLTLFLSTDSKSMNPPEPLVVDISLNNTSSKSLTLTRSDNWSRSDLNLGPCSTLPFGISILKGYYTEQNMTGVRSLVLYQNIPCPGPLLIKSYTFQPLSSKATQVCDTLFSCTGLVDMTTHLEINGFIDNNNQHQPFKVGTYTIIAGDEWGHVTIQHFTEAYAVAYDNSNLKGS